MNPLGGYFGLELPWGEEFHNDALRLNTGRNCLEYILHARQYRKVYIPYYTCDVVLEPFHKLDVGYEFYSININFEIAQEIILQEGEALLYTNYYGLTQRYVERLAEQYGHQLIVDNTQAFYAMPVKGVDTFYTCRKFFGVPDGAYLYTDKPLDLFFEQDVSWERMSFLCKRIDLGPEAGYIDFRDQSHKLAGQPILRMSNLTRRLLKSIDYRSAAIRRRRNYQYLHQFLGSSNLIDPIFDDDAVPMIYPFLIGKEGLREHLIRNKIFVARYWPNVLKWAPPSSLESKFADMLLPLPIDQRYDEEHMQTMVNTILNAE